MKTIDYYNKQADQFIHSTLNVDMEALYQPFLEQLAHDTYILDLGCGSGRDTLAFRKKGYHVDAIDYSEEHVKKATELTGLKVRYQSFYDLAEYETYYNIWASASLLHAERALLPDVMM